MGNNNEGWEPVPTSDSSANTSSDSSSDGWEPVASQDVPTSDNPTSQGIDISAGPAAMLRAPFVTKGISPMEAFNHPERVPKFEAVYSDMIQKAVLNVPGVSNLPTDAQIALMHTASYPGAIAGALVDTTLNPIESIAALSMGGMAKGAAAAEDFMAPIAERILTKMKKPSPDINFGGNEELTKIAEGASQSLQAAQKAFKEGYNTLFEKVGDKAITQNFKNGLTKIASSALEQTSPGSFADKYIQDKFPEILKDGELTIQKLHAIKGDIFKHAKASLGVDKNALMKIYDGINQVLSNPSMAGNDYAYLTKEYQNFYNDEARYVKDLILDKFKNVSGKKLAKTNLIGVKTPINLADNYRTAFEKLSGRKTSSMDVLRELDAVRRGTMIKRAVEAGAAVLLSPELKKVASFVASSK